MNKNYYTGHFAMAIITIVLCMNWLSAGAQKSGVELAGDIIQIGLPLSAFGSTFFFQNKYEGTKQAFQTLSATVATSYFLKFLIDEPRPNGGRFSFPSGHTSITFAGAAFLQKRYGWQFGVPAYLLAGYTGWSRIYAHKHDVWDVLGGAAIGVFFAHVFTDIYIPENVAVSMHIGDDFTVCAVNFTF